MADTFFFAADASGTAVLEIHGDLDAHAAVELRAVVTTALENCPPRLVIDLARVGFIDSMGLGVIVTAAKRADAIGAIVRLARPTPSVQRTLAMFGLDALVEPDADQLEVRALE